MIIAPTMVTTAAADDKGDFANRTKWIGARIANALKSEVADTFVLAGTAAAGYGILKNKGFAAMVAAPAKWIATTKPWNFVKDAVVKGFKYVAGNGRLGKNKVIALASVGLVALAALSHIGRKNAYNAGQIDQKYTDIAKIQEHTKTHGIVLG